MFGMRSTVTIDASRSGVTFVGELEGLTVESAAAVGAVRSRLIFPLAKIDEFSTVSPRPLESPAPGTKRATGGPDRFMVHLRV
tara:strand:- start:142 stop:390 length:249 start_codon:yes stop_codon:yes gene_type:complete